MRLRHQFNALTCTPLPKATCSRVNPGGKGSGVGATGMAALERSHVNAGRPGALACCMYWNTTLKYPASVGVHSNWFGFVGAAINEVAIEARRREYFMMPQKVEERLN